MTAKHMSADGRTGSENIIALPDAVTNAKQPPSRLGRIGNSTRQRFRVLTFINRNGAVSWRVQGQHRSGKYIRENFKERAEADVRATELQLEHLGREQDMEVRATKLTAAEIGIAEAALGKLDEPGDLLRAVDHWLRHGKQRGVEESPRLDDAVEQFKVWAEKKSNLRPATAYNQVCRVKLFKNAIGNPRVADIGIEDVESYLDNRSKNVSGLTKHNDLRVLSRFFSWCIERPRRWCLTNPCAELHVDTPQAPPPTVLALDQCERLLRAAEQHNDGIMLPYVVVCLIAGLRPTEAARLEWNQVNLVDDEIRLERHQTKTGKPRTIAFNDGPPEQKPFNVALKAWLTACHGKAFKPESWRTDFDAVRKLAGIIHWPNDVMRHTAVSHYFRLTGSYGRSAEMFGNSEAIIKAHYQGRVSSADAAKFYALRPTANA